jgi:hypothetical protein
MTEVLERLVRRHGRITTRRPQVPRELRYDPVTRLLSWKGPADRTPFTHYRIRLEKDSGPPTHEVSAGQTAVVVIIAKRAFVSSYNFSNGMESPQAQFVLPDVPPDPDAEVTLPPNVLSVAADYAYYDAPENSTRPGVTAGVPDHRYAGVKMLEFVVRLSLPPVEQLDALKRFHFFVESPDTSANAGTFKLDGTTPIDGSVIADGSEWVVMDAGEQAYDKENVNQVYRLKGFNGPNVDTTARVYVVTKSETGSNPLVRANAPTPTPSTALLVSPLGSGNPGGSLPGGGASPSGGNRPLGEEYARVVTNVTAELIYTVDQAGNDFYHYACSWRNPNQDGNFTGIVITEALSDAGELDAAYVSEGREYWASASFPVPSDAWTSQLTFYSYNRDPYTRRNTYVRTLTARFDFLIELQRGPAEEEFAPKVQNFSAMVYYEASEAGDQKYGFTSEWELPENHERFKGVKLVWRPEGTTGLEDRSVGIETDGVMWATSGPWPVPYGGDRGILYAVSMDGSNRANTIGPGTPNSGLLIIERQPVSATELYAPLVTGVSATLHYEYSEAGDLTFWFTGAWTLPDDMTYFRGVKVICRPVGTTGDEDIGLAIEQEGSTAFESTTEPVAFGPPWQVQILFVSMDANNRVNDIDINTPRSAVLTVEKTAGPAGQEQAPNVKSVSWGTATQEQNEIGAKAFSVDLFVTPPDDVSVFRGVKIVMVAYSAISGSSGYTAKDIGIVTYHPDVLSGNIHYVTPLIPIAPWPDTVYYFYAVSIDANNRANKLIMTVHATNVAPPNVTPYVRIDHLVGQQGTGALKLNRTDLATVSTEFGFAANGKFEMKNIDFSKGTAFDPGMFEVSAGVFKYKELYVEKLKGTVASFGGPGMAGLFAVFNYTGDLIGWIGDDRTPRSGYPGTGSGFEGAWFKRLLIGGSGPSTAKIVADSAGNVAISNAIFTLTAVNGIVQISDALFSDGAVTPYVSTGVNVIAPGPAASSPMTWHVSRGIVGYWGVNQVFSLNVDPASLGGSSQSGELVLRNNGYIQIVASGINGVIRAKVFQVVTAAARDTGAMTVLEGFTGVIPAGRPAIVRGGIVIGYEEE